MDIYDMTIIGAGPTGLFGAFYAGLRGMRAKIIEALPEPGGQLTVLYPEKFIYDSPGFPKIMAKDLVKNLVEQASAFKPIIHYNETAKAVHLLHGNVIQLETDKNIHFSRALLIATGIGAFVPNKLPIPDVDKYESNGLYYFVKDKNEFKGKKVLIVGGGDSAVDWALTLKDWAKNVTLVHRRDMFRAHERNVAELMSSAVDVKLFCELKAIHGDSYVSGATLLSSKTNERTEISVDAIITALGHKADLGPMKDWGLELDGRFIRVNSKMETNIPGVYAAGDIASQPDSAKLNLIATGFAHAVLAVNIAKKKIDPIAPLYEHSSERRL